jgi:cyclopropane-fatty-acyl-phospholipid synthase
MPMRYTAAMTRLEPFYQQVQAHYDLSDDFFALFLDPTRTYSCAYFERDGMTLEQAQRAKIDLALGKCDLKPGLKLLDIGCGWGATAIRAAEAHGVDVIGLTLSRNQHQHAMRQAREIGANAACVEFRLQGWEEFNEPVDRIVSIGAFEHFRKSRYAAFFEKCRRLLPDGGGRMLLHTIVMTEPTVLGDRGLKVEHEHVLFAKFIGETIFPGGQLCFPSLIVEHAKRAGFEVQRIHALGPHYARTLDVWASNLKSQRDQAIALTSPQVYDDYIRYFTGCANYFRSGHIDVMQFTLAAI